MVAFRSGVARARNRSPRCQMVNVEQAIAQHNQLGMLSAVVPDVPVQLPVHSRLL